MAAEPLTAFTPTADNLVPDNDVERVIVDNAAGRGYLAGVSHYGDFKINLRLDANFGTIDRLRTPFYDHEACNKEYADRIAAAALAANEDQDVVISANTTAISANTTAISDNTTAIQAFVSGTEFHVNSYETDDQFLTTGIGTKLRIIPGIEVFNLGGEASMTIGADAKPGIYNAVSDSAFGVRIVGEVGVTLYDGTDVQRAAIIAARQTSVLVTPTLPATSPGVFPSGRKVRVLNSNLTTFGAIP